MLGTPAVVPGECAQKKAGELPADHALKSIAGRYPHMVESLERGEVLEEARRAAD